MRKLQKKLIKNTDKTATVLRKVYNIRKIGRQTKIACVVESQKSKSVSHATVLHIYVDLVKTFNMRTFFHFLFGLQSEEYSIY